jgi:hypothetical protein
MDRMKETVYTKSRYPPAGAPSGYSGARDTPSRRST